MKMRKGDLCFFYHSVTNKDIVGMLKLLRPDPTDKTDKFVVVDVIAVKKIKISRIR